MICEVNSTVSALTARFLNETNKNGETPLHWASKVGKAEFVQVLLAWDADCIIRETVYQHTAIDMAWRLWLAVT